MLRYDAWSYFLVTKVRTPCAAQMEIGWQRFGCMYETLPLHCLKSTSRRTLDIQRAAASERHRVVESHCENACRGILLVESPS